MKKNLEKGLSLPELMIATVVSSIAALLLVNVLVNQNSLFGNQQAKVTQGLSLNETTSRISGYIREASGIQNSYPIQNPTYFTDIDTLILKLPSIDQNGNVISQTYDYLIISPDSNIATVLREQLFADPLSNRKPVNDVLTTNLDSIQFIYTNDQKQPVSPDQASLVNFNINLTTKNGQESVESSASGQTSLRNN